MNGFKFCVVLDQDHIFNALPYPSCKLPPPLCCAVSPGLSSPCLALEDTSLSLPHHMPRLLQPSPAAHPHLLQYSLVGLPVRKWGGRESSRMKHSWHGMYLSALSAGTLEFLSWVCVCTCAGEDRAEPPAAAASFCWRALGQSI